MILSSISIPLLGIVDTAILGHLDNPRYLGAVALGSSILAFVLWGFGFLRMGTTSLTAQAYGAKDHQRAQLLLVQSLLLALVIALGVIAIKPLLLPFAIDLLQASDELSSLALSYSQLRLYSTPAVLCNYVIIGWFIGMQNTRSQLLILVATNGINIILDWLFVLHFGWLSDGAALATVVADYCGLLLALYLMKDTLAQIRIHFHWQKLLALGDYRRLIKTNSNLFFRTAGLLGILAYFASQGAQLGEDVLAGNAVLLQIILLTAYGLDGFAHATEALAGRAIGAGNLRGFYRVCRHVTLLGLATAIGFSLVFWLFKNPIVTLFSDIQTIRTHVDHYFFWVIVMPLVAVWSYLLDGIFIGANQTRAMRDTMLFSSVCFVALWQLAEVYANHGLWFTFTVFNLARGATLGLWFYSLSRQSNWLKAPS